MFLDARATPLLVKIVIAFGGLMIVIATFLAFSEARWLANTKRATADIVDVRREMMNDVSNRPEGFGYRVVFRFVADDGRTITVPSNVTSSSTSYHVGDHALVNYQSGRPGSAQLVRWADRWLVAAVFFFIGAVALFIGGVAFAITRRGGSFAGRQWTANTTYSSSMPAQADRATMARKSEGSQPGSSSAASRSWWIGGAIVAALGVGFAGARFSGRFDGQAATPIRNVQAANGNTGPGNMSGGKYPSGDWTVKAPPSMAAPRLAAGSLPVGYDPRPQARAFLARAENDHVMQTALRAKAATVPGLCPSLSFVPTETFVKMPPPPDFDASGTMTRGSIRQRFAGLGCPMGEPIFNIWVIAAPGLPIRTVVSLMGTTRADIDLQDDATPVAVATARRHIPGCPSFRPLDTKLIGFDRPGDDPARPWTEQWLVAGCGKFVRVAVHFKPDPARQMTGIVAPADEARVMNLRTS